MKVARLHINNFRGIKEANLLFPNHVVLVGDNNVGKSTVFEALDLTLGPDRLARHPKVDEHDFFRGDYLSVEGEPRKEVKIEVTVAELNEEQQNRFVNYIEWWSTTTNAFVVEPPAEGVDDPAVKAAVRITFIGFYDQDEDDFAGDTYFSRSLEESETPFLFRKKEKQYCGFLYLRSRRTASRALSLEHGSLLDVILRLKEIRPQMWEKTIDTLSEFDVASDPELGISGVLESIEKAIAKYVPREWGAAPRLKVSNLTRENLRTVVTAFIATGAGDHAAPFYRQGTGTINMLVLAMLTQIAEDKQNVIFAMEEPETAIPPYAQKRIIHELRKLSSQSLFTSHSPYVLEDFDLDEVVVLTRSPEGVMQQSTVELPASVKHKRYRQEFRTRFCEGLLSRRVLLAEGATEASSMPAVARRLAELNPAQYSSFEALGVCTVDAGTDSQIADLAKLYRNLGKDVYAVCDEQTAANQAAIEAQVTKLFMHGETDIEKLVLKNTTQAAMERFIDSIQLPSHITTNHPNPKANAAVVLSAYFNWAKGRLGLADFLTQCTEPEIPEWISQACRDLRELCQPPKTDDGGVPDSGDSKAGRIIRILFELSPKQKEILGHSGHLLVHGGPGSGKTTISIVKADLLVAEHLRPGQKVLFLSFARATVSRVLEALAEHSTNKTQTRRNVAVDTYHAFFWRVLKTHGYLLGLPRKLEILTPAAQAVALSHIRHEFGPVKKLAPEKVQERRLRLEEELRRLAFDKGQVCFELFADLAADALTQSTKIRALISTAYPVVVLDEFQDTNLGQWRVVQQLGVGSTLIALADEEQRIYDFIGADPERLNQFKVRFAPKEIDLGKENHRSGGTDIAHFGNDLLKGKFRDNYQYDGLRIFVYPANENQALAALKGQTLQALKRLIASQSKHWSLAILVPTKRMMRHVSDVFRTRQESMPAIGHRAAIDMEGAILAAEIIAYLLQPHTDVVDVGELVDLLCNFYRGKGGDDPTATDINESAAIRKAFDKAIDYQSKGKQLPANSIMRAIIAGYGLATSHLLTGNPDDDWVAIRTAIANCGCKRLGEVAEEARNVRFLDRGTQLRDSLSLDWRDNGCYANALSLVRQAFMREHFAAATRPESGVVVMNMHKAKGKQFDEVIIFEGWPRTVKGKVVANLDRIVYENSPAGDLTQARYNFRVSVTRAKVRTTILTPKGDACVLLRQDKS